jgi:hypothetical protein
VLPVGVSLLQLLQSCVGPNQPDVGVEALLLGVEDVVLEDVFHVEPDSVLVLPVLYTSLSVFNQFQHGLITLNIDNSTAFPSSILLSICSWLARILSFYSSIRYIFFSV